ncbi:hypothetical protein Tco_1321144 [Tanacetum coccineum]
MVKNLEGGVKFLMYPRFVQVFLDKQVEGMSKHKEIYDTPSHTEKVFPNMKREGKGFSGRDTPLFPTMMVQAQQEEGEGSTIPTDPHPTPSITQPSSSQPQQKQKPRRKQRKDSGPIEPITEEATNEEHVSTPSYDPPQSGEDRMQLNKLMNLCTKLFDRVLALENTNTSQAIEIATLKEMIKKLEKKRRSRTYKPKRLYKVGLSRRIKSSDEASLGAKEDASKQGRKIIDIDADAEVTLMDETQGMNDDNLMFDTGVLDEQEVEVEKVVSTAEVTTASATITTAATTITPASTRPKAKGIAKDKGKAKMIDPEKPLKKKDLIAFDEEVARNLKAQLQAELEEEEKLARQREEEANIALIES